MNSEFIGVQLLAMMVILPVIIFGGLGARLFYNKKQWNKCGYNYGASG